MLVKGTHVTNYTSNFKYCQFHLNVFFSLLVFVNKNRSLFLSNSAIPDRNTRYNHNLHLPSTNLTLVQKGVLYSGSKIYNHLPLNIKMLSENAMQFKSKLRSYLIEHTFYSLDEYYQLTVGRVAQSV